MIKKPTKMNPGFFPVGMILMMLGTVMPMRGEAASKTHAVLFSQGQTAKDIVVKGKVKDATGGLPGVTVSLKENVGTAVATDATGNFSIQVPENGTLVFKAIGYETQEIPVNGRTTIDVTMQVSTTDLNEVVVVGYGVQKKVSVTGSISTVRGDDLKQSPAANISGSLAGRTPGLVINTRSGEPGRDTSQILIRGKGTLNDNNPLIVIDGIANRGGFDRLNPEDIASVTILKDAAAAIYGAQAANGVILVTTKRGATGKPTISYTANYGLTQPTRIPELIDAYRFVIYKNELNDRMGIPRQFSDAQVEGYRAGTDPLNFPNTNWYKEVVKELSPQTRHALSLSGGGEKINYFLSGGYLYQDGIFNKSATNFKQYNIRSNSDAQVTKDLKISLDLSGRIEDRNYSSRDAAAIFNRTLITFPTLAAYYPNGLPGAGVESGLNPVLMASGATGYNRIDDSYLQSNISAELKLPFITEGLSLTGTAAYDFRFNTEKLFNDNWDAYNYDPATQQYTNMRNNEGPMTLRERFRNYQLSTYNIRLNYDRRFGDHAFGSFVAYEQSENYNEGIEAFRTGFETNQIDQIPLGPSAGMSNTGSALESARQNIFGRVTYGYKDKYLAEFILRYDGSFNFPKGKQWGTFPGLSVGWRISEEPFFKKSVTFVNELKIKGSWARLGNDRITQFQFMQLFNPDAGYYFGAGSTNVPGLSMGVIPNRNVTWEVAENKNVGLESSLWGGVLNFNADYFQSNRSNILLRRNASIPGSTGLTDANLPTENIGKVNNQGYELELSHNGKVNTNFSYNVGLNFTHAKNKVVFMDEAAATPEWQKREGHPIDSWLIYKSAGLYRSQAEVDASVHLAGALPGDVRYVDVNGDGKITSNDQIRVYDSATPTDVFGMSLGGKFKGLGLNILLQGQGNAKQVILPQQVNDNATLPVWLFENRWTATNPNGTMPASFDRTDPRNNLQSDFWLRSAAFVRLKTVELSYSFPQKMISSLKMQNLGVYVSGFNLVTLSKIKDYDPELNTVSGTYYPQTRVFNLGVRASL